MSCKDLHIEIVGHPGGPASCQGSLVGCVNWLIENGEQMTGAKLQNTGLTEEEVRALFTLAGFGRLQSVKTLIDGYGPGGRDYFRRIPHQVWWFVKTAHGWIEIGWRKRVIQIDWSDTGYLVDVTKDDVTKTLGMVHAWSNEKAIEYLRALKSGIDAHLASPSPRTEEPRR